MVNLALANTFIVHGEAKKRNGERAGQCGVHTQLHLQLLDVRKNY